MSPSRGQAAAHALDVVESATDVGESASAGARARLGLGAGRSRGSLDRSARRLARIAIASDASDSYDVRPKLANAVKALGNNAVADLVGVSRSQPGRWVRGEEGISADNQAAIVDLDFVLSLLLRAMSPDLAGLWLTSPNAHLGGARPVDVFVLEGQRRVVDAIQAYAEGAFA